ncbi:hypothetical protein LTR91_015786 [Friedmanniomyces endolithicus]|uniref:Uncharacterized protein n=1 Tax=Friedmanniomyces endolithicus TaxID=329885 RepID=A0AAN6QLQ4_9PEZI|nr:hypothetical protein LTR57_001925 [Friedmanniomyces endolithicus]KAK0961275.1 hypothetical protein LTS01_020449 [Friedmanniomyces endolithicus]KAK0970783.1 hypothetical protein LTR91_015786 [Friedmanniomyces endolithicus]KAK1032908.1 hypothetical protein LTS16_016762 [Friedmanniomyces endolithicus]
MSSPVTPRSQTSTPSPTSIPRLISGSLSQQTYRTLTAQRATRIIFRATRETLTERRGLPVLPQLDTRSAVAFTHHVGGQYELISQSAQHTNERQEDSRSYDVTTLLAEDTSVSHPLSAVTAAAYQRNAEFEDQTIRAVRQAEIRIAADLEASRRYCVPAGTLPYLWTPEASPITSLASPRNFRRTRRVNPATMTLMRTIERRFDMTWAPDRSAHTYHLHSHPMIATVTDPVHAEMATATQLRQTPVVGESLHQLQVRGYRTDDPEEIPHSAESALPTAPDSSPQIVEEQQQVLRRTAEHPRSDHRIQYTLLRLLSLRQVLDGSTPTPERPDLAITADPPENGRRMALSELYRPPPSAQGEAFADIARRAAAATAVETARTWPQSAAAYSRLVTTPSFSPQAVGRDFATRPVRNYVTDNESFMANVRIRNAQFATRTRRQTQARLQRRPNLVEPDRQVYYDLCFGPHRYLGVMSFNWQPDERRGHRQGSSWRAVRVATDVASRILSKQVVDQVVVAELWIAVRREVIGAELAEDIWERWSESGEPMRYEMEDRDNVLDWTM